jgi:hypothetical protein
MREERLKQLSDLEEENIRPDRLFQIQILIGMLNYIEEKYLHECEQPINTIPELLECIEEEIDRLKIGE